MNKFKLLTIIIGLTLSSYSIAAEFNNQCTNGLSQGISFKTNCEIKETYEGKTYCFSSESAKATFLAKPQHVIQKANAFYAKNADKAVVEKITKDVEPEREKISQADALKQINSKTCDLSNKDAGYLEFDKMDLRHCKMVNTSFFGAYLRGANLSGANMQKSYLNLARIEDANLSGADLTDATIFQAIFDKTNFQGANLTNARMIGTLGNVNMSDATVIRGRFGLDIGNQPMGAMRFDAIGGNFSNTNFEGADINRSNFRFANFKGANLRNTDLFRADFSKADLTGADITGAKMAEAILDGTIMTNVKGLEAIKGYEESKGKCVDCTLK
ncbi:MAG: pentapeptide repeat-containing protein [Methylotenera sp.]|uniref:pentapeptide repeat-containing protein n=1 Tax=Methylotenera sp. TaxID=2051956 RepID=UPI00248A36A4|nr:pentapeptide repeat-containing protein [Methylotenera sp.]MDI1308409.1 pentapeptide repeat-containing protein [Methylotenera sp.]